MELEAVVVHRIFGTLIAAFAILIVCSTRSMWRMDAAAYLPAGD